MAVRESRAYCVMQMPVKARMCRSRFARMMELVVISALKADGDFPREGSSPSSRIVA